MGGATFRRLRKRLALSQAKLAERVGVSANTVYRWEVDAVSVPPPVAVLMRLLVELSKEE
jgi:transcriptional regulator with XRE-family HTH domain